MSSTPTHRKHFIGLIERSSVIFDRTMMHQIQIDLIDTKRHNTKVMPTDEVITKGVIW